MIKGSRASIWLPFLIVSSALSIGVDTLGLDAYIRLALEHNPTAAGAKAATASSEAAYRATRSKLLPHLDGTAQAGRSNSQSSIPSASAATDQYSAGVSANQLLFDFGKSIDQTRQSNKLLAASREDEQESRRTVTLNAKVAYFNYLLAQLLDQVALETLKQSQQHLEEAQMLFETGKQARYDVTKAEVDVANAQVALIKAADGIRLGHVQLETSAGMTLPDSLTLSDSLAVHEADITLEKALAGADSNRAELRAARARLEAAQLQLQAQKAALFPSINASAGYGYRKYGSNDWNDNWSIGLNAAVPIFEGGSLKAGIDQAAAGAGQAAASLDQSRQNVIAEVKQRILEKSEAQERIAAAIKYVAQAQEGLTMSQERYRAGASTFIEVTDAEVALSTARNTLVQALFDYRVAHARLHFAMGAE